MDFDKVYQLIVMALLIEAIVQALKPIWETAKRTPEFYLSLGVSMIAAVALNYLAGLDIFSLAGVPLKIPVVGELCTGVLMYRGSGGVHDLYKTIQDLRYKLAAE